MREFQGVPNQVRDDLPQPDRVADELRGYVGRYIAGEGQSLRARLDHQRNQRSLERLAYRKHRSIDLELARLDLGKIEDIVDHHQQRLGRLLAKLQVPALLL